MSLTAIQNYVAGLVDGLVGPYENPPLQAWVDPPTGLASAETPLAYILNAEGEGQRQSMAYTAGYYVDVHQVTVYVEWMFPPNAENANLAFTSLLDAIITKIRTNYQGAIFITDPATSLQSQLLVIGDRLRWRYLPQRNLGEGQAEWLDYVGQIVFEVQEKVQYVSVTDAVEVEFA